MTEIDVRLKPCPFCGAKATMVVRRDFGGIPSLRIEVPHDGGCPVWDKKVFRYGYLGFDTESEEGRLALGPMVKDLAETWNRRNDG